MIAWLECILCMGDMLSDQDEIYDVVFVRSKFKSLKISLQFLLCTYIITQDMLSYSVHIQ